MALEVFQSKTTNRRASAGAMVNISSVGALKFNVAATQIIAERKIKKVLLLFDPEKRKIAIAPAKAADDRAYTVSDYTRKSVCQIVVREFPRHIGMKATKSFRVALKPSHSPDLILEGIISAEYIGAANG